MNHRGKKREHRNTAGRAIGWLTVLSAASIASADPPPGYYSSVDATDATTLRASLHEVIDDHIRYPYTSGGTDTWDILETAQQDPADSGKIIDIYRNRSYTKIGGGTGPYNREHTWPKSYGFPDDNGGNYPYTDCHHLYLCDSGYNSTRSNKPFRYCSAGCSEQPTDANDGHGGGTGSYPGNSNWTSGSFTDGTWEVWIGRRGDIARTQFYMDVRYEGGNHGGTGSWEPDLILTDNQTLISNSSTGNNETVAYMGMLSALLQWHLEDPVDDRERARNDVVFGFQSNRNPFVDHPEWVACLFNDNCPCQVDADCDDSLFCNGAETCDGNGDCQPGSDPCLAGQTCNETTDTCEGGGPTVDPWINEFHYKNDGIDTGEFVEIAGEAGTDLSGWQVLGYNGNGGAVYRTVDLSGVIPDQQGCMGTLAFDFAPMQNGSPDALALIDDTNTVIEFISYEGEFIAADGAAAGLASVDVGVSETATTPVGQSLQMAGTGSAAGDFTWQPPAANTAGQPNNGQTFTGCTDCTGDGDCDDDDACNGVETCQAGSCIPGTAPDCDDGSFCNGAETCDMLLGCQPGPPACPAGTWCDEAGDACRSLGDFDFDGDVDLSDFRWFQRCYDQPAGGGCEAGDFTGDQFVDQADYPGFESQLNGPL